MRTIKLFAAALATAVCFGSSIMSFGNAQHLTAYQTVSAAENASASVIPTIGDVNGDGVIDSSDAADILIEYSSGSTGKASVLTAGQKKLADLNFDGVIDSSDASLVLMYYAHTSTGGTLSIEDFLHSINTPPAVTTTAVSTAATTQQTQTTTSTRLTRTTATISSKTTAKTTAATKTTAKTTVISTVPTTKATTSTTKPTTSTTKPTTSTTKPTTSTAKPTTTTAKPTTSIPPVTTTEAGPVRVTGIGVTRSEFSLNVGEGALSAYVTMFPINAPNKDEIWTSSNESVAIVNSEGWVSGIGEGECTITVKSVDNPEVSADIKVTVINTKNVKDIRLSRTTMTLQSGYGELAARVTMLPETAINKSEIWSSSKPDVATVDNEGWVIAKNPGNAIITVQSVDNPEVYAIVLVTVVDSQVSQTTSTATETTSPPTTTATTVTTVPVQDIQISANEITLNVGGQCEATVKVLPENATNKAIKWSSSNDKVATVDQFGKIKAVGTGSCSITVSSAENSDIKKSIIVNVKNTETVTEIKLSKYEMNIAIGQSDISWVTMLPSTAPNKDEFWTTSDPSVATVDKYGWVYGVGEGECTVTVFSADNTAVKAEISVKVVNGDVEPPAFDFSYIVPGKSTQNSIAFMLPFPEKANGRFVVDYVITDKNGKITTISTPTIVIPAIKSTITMLTADTNEFTAEAYLTNLNTSQIAKIGTYHFVLNPRDAKTENEDINFAFAALGGISE